MERIRNSVEFSVRGSRALFSNPIVRVGGEKSSYLIPTYESLKGVLSSVYWKPTFIWIVDAVRIMLPIQTFSEGVRPLKYGSFEKSEGGNDLALYTYLRNVEYQVRAHFVWNENRPELTQDRNENKHHNIAKRMIERGGRRDVFLGTRECQAYVVPCIFGEKSGWYDEIEELDFGYIYHGITYADEAFLPKEKGRMTLRFFRAKMLRGVISFPPPEKIPDSDKKYLHETQIKQFSKSNQNFSETSMLIEEL